MLDPLTGHDDQDVAVKIHYKVGDKLKPLPPLACKPTVGLMEDQPFSFKSTCTMP
jgi:hypothetical protein